ncbi:MULTISPECIES: rhomboid family intramembrane serine protease [Paenibacillus]|uniref:Rhomboid family intramembrane serine protease n=1 Tax=Paenibacillus campinasensis TaxID=66347 RepID=A0ABW9T0H6_9BACL|nr:MULTISPECIES: rhomboid family intramembrane serine protease [Paenibacillus]MUG65554.1 rhomboid family intramembrane serine protease [Paenibacillus campinasensis]PAK53954.1 rhomboid family intramembrane serine protease [Paenibacillus sp. 7541]
MIFIRYENWKSYLRYYPVTVLLLIANLVMFIITSFDGGSRNYVTLLKYGAASDLPQVSGELWRLFTAMFLHNGFDHLLFNSFALLVFAPPLERIMGSWKYVLLYLASGVLGNAIGLAYYTRQLDHYTFLVGASGAIYGVYGAYLYIALFQRHVMDEASRKMLYTLLIIGVVFSFAPGISMAGHIGGLIGGFFIYGLMIRLFKTRTSDMP